MPDPYVLAHTGAQLDDSVNRPIPITGGGTGQTARYNTITVTNDTTTVSDHNIAARYFPYLRMCFIRARVKFDNAAVEANTWVPIGSVPADYSPVYTTALTVSLQGTAGVMKPAQAHIKNDGIIEVGAADALLASSDYYAYISGWWLLATT